MRSDQRNGSSGVDGVKATFHFTGAPSGFSRLDEETPEPHQPQQRTRWVPEETAGPLSRLLFSYCNGLVRLGFQRPLEHDDLWDVARRDEAAAVSARFQGALAATADPDKYPQGSVWRAMRKVMGRTFVITAIIKLVHDIIMFLSPYLLERLLHHMAAGGSRRGSFGLAVAILVVALAENFSVNIYFHMLFRMSLHLKISLVDMLYDKSLRITSAVRSDMGSGAIVNLQSNDAAKLWGLVLYLHVVWNGPFQILSIMFLLVRIMHWGPAMAGLAVTVVIIPLTTLLGKALAKSRREQIKFTDQRVKLCAEVITGIKAIKLYAWETPYVDRIMGMRERELKQIKNTQAISMFNTVLYMSGPVLVSLVAFGVYTAMGYSLTAAVAFPALALFNLLRFPIVMLPGQIMSLIQARVGLQRIQKFMEREEMSHSAPGYTNVPDPAASSLGTGLLGASLGAGGVGGGGSVGLGGGVAAGGRPGSVSGLGLAVPLSIRDGTFCWEAGQEAAAVLQDINLEVRRGQLVMIVGQVGSGKSSLLLALLGEMTRRAGSVRVLGSVAYTAQDPWIQNATLRANVLMGGDWDEDAYTATLQACALVTDLELLPAGDMSEIGEKGINLSGGQKHRVALARATYAAADIYLLDDPLSAVDAHVGRHLFDECVCGLLDGKTRLLVTHQLQYLPDADVVVVMEGGRVQHVGSYQELTARGVDLHNYVQEEEEEEEEEEEDEGGKKGEGKAAAYGKGNGTAENGHAFPKSAFAVGGPASLRTDSTRRAVAAAPRAVAASSAVPGAANAAVFAAGDATGSAGGTAGETGTGGADGRLYFAPSVQKPDGAVDPAAVKLKIRFDKSTRGGDDGDANVNGAPSPSANGDVKDRDGGKKEGDEEAEAEDGFAPPSPLRPARFGGGSLRRAGSSLRSRGSKGSLRRGMSLREASGLGYEEERAKLLETMAKKAKDGELVKVEERAKGSVERSVYSAYLSAWSPYYSLPIAIVLGALAERGLQVLQNVVLSNWSQRTAEAMAEGGDHNAHNSYYLSLYFTMGFVSIGIQLLRSVLLIYGSIRASRRLARALLDKVVRLPMSFFDSQPTGRLLNRFTRDVEALDVNVSGTVNTALTFFVAAVLSMCVVIGVAPVALAAFLPLVFIYYRVQQLYVACSRELKRLDSLAFSPIFQHFGESLSGLVTIRAFRKQDLFMDKNRANLNHSNRAYWPIQVVNRWLSVRLEAMGAAVVFTAAVMVAVVFPKNAGLAGLAITSALNLTGIMNWMVRQTTELEVNMNSIERMIEYNRYDEEAAAVIEHSRPPRGWPSNGAISVKDLVVSYRPELPPVLRGLTFEVQGRHKVGVCGRTGCGKSTLMMTLYRLVEPRSGLIAIDGVDITSLGLYDLRSRLSLVPQDPVIFSGTVRSNLDPFGEQEAARGGGGDSAIWEALRRAGLEDMVKGLDKGLDADVKEGGANISVGQRQLLCMARALLRASRILVLDEATSNVDNGTDSLIQRTIRTAFKDCTVLTIAHRLHTIIDSDRILVLEAGLLAEYDTPAALLRNPSSHFRSLVDETVEGGGATGDVVAQALKAALGADAE